MTVEGKTKWTYEQEQAINTRDRTLLVSAAAGSGKTAVLTERIIQTLTDEEHPGDISRMLIVTFTRAAAAELRTRIAGKLQKAIEERGTSSHLSRQLLLLPTAEISTIDSFCLNLVRENAVRLDLSPSFRLADKAENVLLLGSVMKNLIEDCYEGRGVCSDKEFCDLVDCLTGTKGDDDLPEILLSLYDKTKDYTRGCDMIADMAQNLACDATREPFETEWGKKILQKSKYLAEIWSQAYPELVGIIAADEYAAPFYLPTYEQEASVFSRLSDALKTEKYAAVREVILRRKEGKISLKRMDKDKKSEAVIACAERRNIIQGELDKLYKEYYAYSEEDLRVLLHGISDKIALIGRIIKEFGDRVWKEKRRRGVLSFADVSACAVMLLIEKDGTPTPLAKEVSRRYDAVYVDEYQDVNQVQHKIFEVIAGERGRFMVGDIKQSIYGFRGAQPDIFAAIRQEFPPLEESGDGPFATISLAKNFRSLPPVLRFTNLVFSRLMEGVGESIKYKPEEDELDPGRKDEPPTRVTVALFEKAGRKTSDTESDEEDEAEEDEEIEEEQEEQEGLEMDAEAAYVAAEIERILASRMTVKDKETKEDRPIRPSDIAILVRRNSVMDKFAKALGARGIACELSAKRGFFLNPEILLALSLLNVVDNPRRDVYLAALLRSPLYGFTMDELIAIRRENDAVEERRKAPLYEALCRYTEAHPEFERGRVFLSALSSFRLMAEGQPVDRLIWQLYRETGLLAIAGADKQGSPDLRRANLMMLYDYARRFEASSYRGLYNFIAYINEAIENVSSIEDTQGDSDRTDTVRIITVHHSKGLEYPVCFVSDCGYCFQDKDAKKTLLFDKELGCALRLRDESGFVRVSNPVYRATAKAIVEHAREEEMRVLYVALTRAQDRLYVTGALSDLEKSMEKAAERGRNMSAEDAYACRNYMEMILAATAGNDSFDLVMPEVANAPTVTEDVSQESASLEEAEVAQVEACLRERFDFLYPYHHLTRLPGKMSVSRLHPAALDEGEIERSTELPEILPTVEKIEQVGGRVLQNEDGTLIFEDEDRPTERKASIPRFMGGKRNTAAMAGTATHLFMQFCDFAALQREGGVEAEKQRLKNERFIAPEDAELVRLPEIKAFANSFLLREIVSAKKMWKELRFHVRLPAASLTDIPEKKEAYASETVLVQGVMDCVLERENGELWLLDYKTDRLTREEKHNRAAAEDKLIRRHALQLSYYAAACRRIFGRAPDRVMVYSLALGDVVDVPVLPVE